MAILYIIATPIGNLEDFTFRGLRILKEVYLILAEDTRKTRKLLSYYNISTPLLNYHQHSKLKKVNYILNLLKEGRDLALVSEAGTPGISDPGNKLVKQVVESLGNKVKISPVPGPSALIAAVSIAGVPMDKFLFLGFPPSKRKRKKFFEKITHSEYPVIFYESPHRLLKSLKELSLAIGNKRITKIVVCKELTKKFEKIYRGDIQKVIKEIEQDLIKGEYVIITQGLKPDVSP